MTKYHKINTLWKRDMDAPGRPLIEGDWSLPEFEYLSELEWTFSEKVDGTNVRIHFDPEMDRIFYLGRTDRATLPKPLVEWLWKRLDIATVRDLCRDATPLTLYGEGYGHKIQSGGKYRDDQSFVLFDVRVGDFWLKREAVRSVADQLRIDCVPEIGSGTLLDAVRAVEAGLTSTWGDFEAEGIVARPAVELLDRNGSRIITKIKARDFR